MAADFPQNNSSKRKRMTKMKVSVSSTTFCWSPRPILIQCWKGSYLRARIPGGRDAGGQWRLATMMRSFDSEALAGKPTLLTQLFSTKQIVFTMNELFQGRPRSALCCNYLVHLIKFHFVIIMSLNTQTSKKASHLSVRYSKANSDIMVLQNFLPYECLLLQNLPCWFMLLTTIFKISVHVSDSTSKNLRQEIFKFMSKELASTSLTQYIYPIILMQFYIRLHFRFRNTSSWFLVPEVFMLFYAYLN